MFSHLLSTVPLIAVNSVCIVLLLLFGWRRNWWIAVDRDLMRNTVYVAKENGLFFCICGSKCCSPNVWKLYPEWFTVSTLVVLYETNTSKHLQLQFSYSFVTSQKLWCLYMLFLSNSRSSKETLLQQQWNQSDRPAKAILLSCSLFLAPEILHFLSFF